MRPLPSPGPSGWPALLCPTRPSALRRAFDDPFTWGVLLVDLARHASRIYALEAGLNEAEALAEIRRGIAAELAHPTDPGSTQAVN